MSANGIANNQIPDISTDLNVSPYFDDHDDSKNYYRILFNPALATQARELTQLQTITQRQISKIGSHFFKDGALTPQANIDRFLATKEKLDLAIIAESARWGDSKREPAFTRDSGWILLIILINNSH